MVIFLFPGQGSQFPGMARELFDQYGMIRDLFAEASEACGRNMEKLLFDSPEEELKDTRNAQPALSLASLSVWKILRERGFSSHFCGGHSLGEYNALVDAGVLSVYDCLKAVSARGEIMARAGEAITARKGAIGMAAVLGMELPKVREIVAGFEDVWCANENGPDQVVLGGTLNAIGVTAEALKAAGAKRVVPLKVSCPFHTPLMKDCAGEMAKVLEDIQFSEPVKKVWSNVTAEAVESGKAACELMVRQITEPVRWMDLTCSMARTAGESITVYEVGPGRVLAGLWAKSGLEGTCFPAGNARDVKNILR